MIQSTIYLVEDGQDCIACNKRNEAKQIARQWCDWGGRNGSIYFKRIWPQHPRRVSRI